MAGKLIVTAELVDYLKTSAIVSPSLTVPWN